MPIYSRYSSTDRLDRTITRESLSTRRERLYRSNTPDNAHRLSQQLQSRGDRLASELRQIEANELDLSDFLDTLRDITQSDIRIHNRLSSRLTDTLRNNDCEQCSDCNCWTMPDELTTLDDNSGDCLCNDCRDDNATYCDSCNNTIRRDDSFYVDDSNYCRSCYEEQFTTCDRCGETVSHDDTHTVTGNRGNENTWCDSCCGDYAHYCDSESEYRTSPCSDCDCDSCHGDDCDCRHCSLVLDYSTTLCGALGELPANRVASHVLGAELELEVSDRNEYAKSLRELYAAKLCHCKRDGSLDSDSGVEVVTGHGTQSELLAILETAANLARQSYSGLSHKGDSCGLHIGLDRSQFSSALQARIIVFWNSGENYQFLRQFTRRDYRNLSYCQIKPEKACNAFIARPDLSSREKYEIVNTRHATHLEFRGFRGSLLPRTLRACVSLVSLIATYCETASTAAELTSGRFIDWLLHHVDASDERRLAIAAYLTHRGEAIERYAANYPLAPSSYPLFES